MLRAASECGHGGCRNGMGASGCKIDRCDRYCGRPLEDNGGVIDVSSVPQAGHDLHDFDASIFVGFPEHLLAVQDNAAEPPSTPRLVRESLGSSFGNCIADAPSCGDVAANCGVDRELRASPIKVGDDRAYRHPDEEDPDWIACERDSLSVLHWPAASADKECGDSAENEATPPGSPRLASAKCPSHDLDAPPEEEAALFVEAALEAFHEVVNTPIAVALGGGVGVHVVDSEKLPPDVNGGPVTPRIPSMQTTEVPTCSNDFSVAALAEAPEPSPQALIVVPQSNELEDTSATPITPSASDHTGARCTSFPPEIAVEVPPPRWNATEADADEVASSSPSASVGESIAANSQESSIPMLQDFAVDASSGIKLHHISMYYDKAQVDEGMKDTPSGSPRDSSLSNNAATKAAASQTATEQQAGDQAAGPPPATSSSKPLASNKPRPREGSKKTPRKPRSAAAAKADQLLLW